MLLMKNIFFLSLSICCVVDLNAGGSELAESSSAHEENASEQQSLSTDSDVRNLLSFLRDYFAELKIVHQAESNSQKDQKIIGDFLGQCRDSLQEVTTLLDRLDETTRNTLLNSPQADIYKERLQQLEIVTAWAEKDPLTVAALIAQILQKE